MNFINVDPAVYYEASTIVNRAASAFFTTYDRHLQAMSGTGAMAGSAGPGKEWATSYDQQVRDTNDLVTQMMLVLDKYARVLNQAGYVYASSDHDPESGTPAPEKPPTRRWPTPAARYLRRPPVGRAAACSTTVSNSRTRSVSTYRSPTVTPTS